MNPAFQPCDRPGIRLHPEPTLNFLAPAGVC